MGPRYAPRPARAQGLDRRRDLAPGSGPPGERTIPHAGGAPQARRSSAGTAVACFEPARPATKTHRLRSSVGVRCDVIIPTLIPRRPTGG
jgi:hypothetical protein